MTRDDAAMYARMRRLTAYAVEQVAAHREKFGHLPIREYMAAVDAQREHEDAELLRLIDAGYFDGPEAER